VILKKSFRGEVQTNRALKTLRRDAGSSDPTEVGILGSSGVVPIQVAGRELLQDVKLNNLS
jgi:hypothetical protein